MRFSPKPTHRSPRVATALLAISLLAAASPGTAATVAGVRFETRIDGDLALRGAALLRYRQIFKAYAAALYLGDEVDPDEALADVPRRLEIEYFWGIGADDFQRATREGIARNVSAERLAELDGTIERFNRFYADVQPGDRYALTYRPGQGTELALNGRPLGSVAGADFAAAIFAIWLGEAPLDASLKRRLLGATR